MKPLGLQLYTVREAAETDPIGTLRRVAEIGFKGVEGGIGYAKLSTKEFRKVLDDLGLVACSFGGPVPNSGNLQQLVEAAGILGTRLMMAGKGPEDFRTIEAIRRTADEVQTGSELFKDAGLRLCYHNHWWEMNRIDGRLAEEILIELAPELSLEVDLYWAQNFGKVDVPAFVAMYKKIIPLLHVKDGSLVPHAPAPPPPAKPPKYIHAALGRGKVDIPAVIRAADPKVLEWLILEIDNVEGDIFDAMKESYRYMIDNELAEGNRR